MPTSARQRVHGYHNPYLARTWETASHMGKGSPQPVFGAAYTPHLFRTREKVVISPNTMIRAGRIFLTSHVLARGNTQEKDRQGLWVKSRSAASHALARGKVGSPVSALIAAPRHLTRSHAGKGSSKKGTNGTENQVTFLSYTRKKVRLGIRPQLHPFISRTGKAGPRLRPVLGAAYAPHLFRTHEKRVRKALPFETPREQIFSGNAK